MTYGIGFNLNKDKVWPAYVNKQLGWVCIGYPEKAGEAVEFMRGCVAVVADGDLVSLWLKPQELPALA